VAALVNAAAGTVSANYEYGPFGETIRITGTAGKANPMRFSSKYQDDETGLLYYGFRYYNPSTGRWPNRDPIQEKGGNNLYAFVANRPIGAIDRNGQITITTVQVGPTTDGSCDVRFDFTLDKRTPTNGYMVQEVWDSWSYTDISTGEITAKTFILWEAFLVKGNCKLEYNRSNWPPLWKNPYTDMFTAPAEPGTVGSRSITGVVKFFFAAHTQNLKGFGGSNQQTGANGGPSSGTAPSTDVRPTWWLDPSDNGEATASHAVYTSWTPSTIGVSP
jgi:RHS repeat-associated protein